MNEKSFNQYNEKFVKNLLSPVYATRFLKRQSTSEKDNFRNPNNILRKKIPTMDVLQVIVIKLVKSVPQLTS